MSIENLTESSPLSSGIVTDRPKSQLGNLMLWLQLIVFILGLGLLFYVIYRIGFQTVAVALQQIGWGFLIIVALNGIRHFLRALCIYLAIPSEQRSFKYRNALTARLGGEAISVITFTGPFLGDVTKAALLKRNVSFRHSAAAIIVDNILYYVSVLLMILGGFGLMLYAYGSNEKVIKYALFGIGTFACLIFIGLISTVKFHFNPVSWLIGKLSNRNLLPQFIAAKKEHINEIENNVHQFYQHRKKAFYAISGLIIVSHLLSVLEVYSALYLLNFAPSVANSYIIESLTKVINLVFSFVPGTVGVYEGGNGVILHSLGYAVATGVTLALVRRGAILFWTFIGLLILLWRTINRSKRHLVNRTS